MRATLIIFVIFLLMNVSCKKEKEIVTTHDLYEVFSNYQTIKNSILSFHASLIIFVNKDIHELKIFNKNMVIDLSNFLKIYNSSFAKFKDKYSFMFKQEFVKSLFLSAFASDNEISLLNNIKLNILLNKRNVELTRELWNTFIAKLNKGQVSGNLFSSEKQKWIFLDKNIDKFTTNFLKKIKENLKFNKLKTINSSHENAKILNEVLTLFTELTITYNLSISKFKRKLIAKQFIPKLCQKKKNDDLDLPEKFFSFLKKKLKIYCNIFDIYKNDRDIQLILHELAIDGYILGKKNDFLNDFLVKFHKKNFRELLNFKMDEYLP